MIMNLFPIELSAKYIEKAQELYIQNNDIIEQFIHGSGHGGQKINKTSSTVYLKHLPTGIEIKCQAFRERGKNRIQAYKLLIDKIEFLKKGKESEKAKKNYKLKKQKQKRSKRAKEKILEQKHLRSEVKKNRTQVKAGF
ncbi:MAG: hypothetical protein UR28_C0016G0016 [Candidatus Peregrinibacteria bacterium GW2011_GWF2_33_10]|nr:MAG: hypothetical protein UR28_C0016G0016 [Candidatus Peregrinibacteria bacterium GW2011_GWF2_33_10]OGJ45836.1 MAG: hypothetical protein A2263_03530 [Candidatus Peregrinibacteria bacterium RIFOXYA2_FULL_33_21]OGJ46496.1 MAG: hypothetical protein A2272_03590 [Candidatus Peregrinibacteria bacterium RIFOXYA12_FULL_33_12]OGJ51373.1 MAG: hypothetical protein A2307_02370 [Candidatus Peregrinibacteria bacterium RIFOXYB2_FULL_33_20]